MNCVVVCVVVVFLAGASACWWTNDDQQETQWHPRSRHLFVPNSHGGANGYNGPGAHQQSHAGTNGYYGPGAVTDADAVAERSSCRFRGNQELCN